MILFVHPGSRIRILTFYPSRILDQGVKKAPDPGSGSATLIIIIIIINGGCVQYGWSGRPHYEAAAVFEQAAARGRGDHGTQARRRRHSQVRLFFFFFFHLQEAVVGIRDILGRIRIPGSVPLANGSGSGSGSNSGSDYFLQ